MTIRFYRSVAASLQDTSARAGEKPGEQRAVCHLFHSARPERSAARREGAAAISILIIIAQLMWWPELQKVFPSGAQLLLLTISFIAFAAIVSGPHGAGLGDDHG